MSKNKYSISKYTPLESLEMLYNNAKIKAGPSKSKWTTYAALGMSLEDIARLDPESWNELIDAEVDEMGYNEILAPHYVRLQSIIKNFQRIERIVQEYPRGLMGSQQARANAYILGQIMQVVADAQTAEAEQILTEELKSGK